jgi:hypothetical protein
LNSLVATTRQNFERGALEAEIVRLELYDEDDPLAEPGETL